jgi:hypothetical protein
MIGAAAPTYDADGKKIVNNLNNIASIYLTIDQFKIAWAHILPSMDEELKLYKTINIKNNDIQAISNDLSPTSPSKSQHTPTKSIPIKKTKKKRFKFFSSLTTTTVGFSQYKAEELLEAIENHENDYFNVLEKIPVIIERIKTERRQKKDEAKRDMDAVRAKLLHEAERFKGVTMAYLSDYLLFLLILFINIIIIIIIIVIHFLSTARKGEAHVH